MIRRCLLLSVAVGVAALPLPAESPLADAIQAGKLDRARELVRAAADVNSAQPDGTRPIHWAVFRVDHELVAALIAKKAEVNVSNALGSTPIAEAAKLGDAKLVKLLLDAGANPEGANLDGETALMAAIKLGHLPVVEMLVAAGANVNAIEQFQKQTPLMYAVTAPRNAAEMTRLLLAKGADPKPRAVYNDWESQITSEPRAQYRATGGLTALLYAARDGCYYCAEALLDAGADPNVPTPEAVTPLMIALDNDHNEIAKLLLDRGATPGVWDWWGRTPLYIAVDRKVVAEVGAADVLNVNRKSPPPLPPPPGVAKVSRMEIVQAILDKGVDPNPQLNMHRPSRSGNVGRFIDPLLSTGATPLLRAALGRDLEVMKALLAKGASPNMAGVGSTPFLTAAGAGTGVRLDPIREPHMEAVELLLQHGADVNAQVTGTLTYNMRIARTALYSGGITNEGMTALHAAAWRGDVTLARYLLAHGADPRILDHKGRTALDVLEAAMKEPRTPQNATENGPNGPFPKRFPSAEEAAELRSLLTPR